MKFYKDKSITNFWSKIRRNKLTAIYIDTAIVVFLKNGDYHNYKNAALISYDGFKSFRLNNKYYGCEYNFTKKSWRKFAKLQAFL